ncbi:MAG TPA: acyl-CoA dehydrogenase, partial [Actinomycetes bacterium]
MDFAPTAAAAEMQKRLQAFMDEHVFPAEEVYAQQRRANIAAGRPYELPPIVESLKAEARARGLWNLFLPEVSGLSVLDYAP